MQKNASILSHMPYFHTSKAVFVFVLQLGEVSECYVQLTLKLRTATSPASCKFSLDLEAQLQLEASSDSVKVLPHVQLSHGNGLLKDSKVSLLALSSIFDLGGVHMAAASLGIFSWSTDHCWSWP